MPRWFAPGFLPQVLLVFLALPAPAFAQTVDANNLANRAVTGPKLAPLSVGKNKIKDGAVTSEKIKDDAVTFSKIKDGAVTSEKIKDGTIQLRDLAPSIPTKGDRGEPGPQGPAGPQGPQGPAGGNDGADGVKITFGKAVKFTYTPEGETSEVTVDALDLNGTALFIDGETKPAIKLGELPLRVIFTGDIPNSLNQQVLVKLPQGILAGTHALVLTNSRGSSSFDIKIAAADFSWRGSGFGSCNKTCGGGTQTQTVWCQRNDNVLVAEHLCSGRKPETTQSCNAQACPTYSWKTSAFGGCSAACGGGTQTRAVVCQSNGGTTVADSFCSGAKPPTARSCNAQTCFTGRWTLSSQSCSSSTLNITYKCSGGTCDPNARPRTTIANGCRKIIRHFLLPDARGWCSGPEWRFIGSTQCSAIIGGHSMYSVEGTQKCGCSNTRVTWNSITGYSGPTAGRLNCQCAYYCPKRNCVKWVPK